MLQYQNNDDSRYENESFDIDPTPEVRTRLAPFRKNPEAEQILRAWREIQRYTRGAKTFKAKDFFNSLTKQPEKPNRLQNDRKTVVWLGDIVKYLKVATELIYAKLDTHKAAIKRLTTIVEEV